MSIEKILRGTIIAGVFALPFIVLMVTSSLFFPYITGKNFAFRIIIEVIFSAWVGLALLNAEYRPRFNVLLVSVGVFVGIVALADIFGANSFKSIWSNFERMEGLITLIHLFAYVLVAGTVLTTEKLWLWFWRIWLSVSALVSAYALLQSLTTGKSRLDSTLGNPIYLAVYTLFHIFIALILLTRRGAVRVEQALYLVALPFLATVLFLTATRGATIGLIGGLLVSCIGIAIALRHEKKVRMFSGVAALALLLVVGGIWIARDTQFVQETQTLKRLTNISLQDDTVFGRTVIWSLAWKGVKERPVLGWGQENFNLVFNTHYDPRMYDQEMWFDRTHNVVFDWLIAAGILGLLAYLSMYLAALWLLYKTTALTLVQKWLVFGLFVGYGFHNLTVFDNIISYVLFFSVLAWLYALSRTEEESSAGVSLSRKYEWGVVGGSILLAVCLMWLVNSAPFASAKGLLTSMRDVAFAQHLARNGDIEQALAQLDRGLSGFKETEALDTVGTQEVRERWVDTAKGFINDEWIPGEVKNTWYGGAVSAMLRQIEEVPDDARFHFLLASLHMEAGNLAVAQDTLKRALELSPRKQAILLHLVIVTNDLEGAESALPYAQQTFELEPENREARIIYGLILLRTGEVNTALSLLEEEPSAGLDNRILHELIRQQAFDDARAVWERGLKEEGKEDHRDSVFMLAQTYVGQGDLIRAAQEVSYIAAMYPSMQSIAEQALEEIKTLQQQ